MVKTRVITLKELAKDKVTTVESQNFKEMQFLRYWSKFHQVMQKEKADETNGQVREKRLTYNQTACDVRYRKVLMTIPYGGSGPAVES